MSSGKYMTLGRINNLMSYEDMQRAAGGKNESAHTAETLLALATERAMDPTIFDETPPVFFEAIISTAARDAYYTYMEPSTLENFAAGAAAGVGVQDSHNAYQLGLGRSLTGELIDVTVQGKKTQGVRSHFFTIPGLGPAAAGNPNTYIDGIRSGIYSDISVGFSIPPDTAEMRCSICGQNMLDWERCTHLNGFWYTAENSEKRAIAEGHIEGGTLNEYSPVYDGATPGAAVSKALAMAKEGMIDEPTAERLTSLYGTRILVPKSFALGGTGTTRKQGDQAGTPKDKEKTSMDFIAQVTDGLRAAGVTLKRGATEEDVLAGLDSALSTIETLKANITEKDKALDDLTASHEELEALAEDGRTYRTDLVTSAVDDLVRTLPEDQRGTFNRDAQVAFLTRQPLADVKSLQKGWQASSQFKAGRGSNEQEDDQQDEPRKPRRIAGVHEG